MAVHAVGYECCQERNAVCTGRSDDERVQNELGQVEFEQTIVSKWTKNMELRQYLQNCVYERRRKTDILKLVKQKFPFYSWSLTNLSRRMKVFGLEFVDNKIPLEKIAQAIQIERQLISCSSTSSSTSTGRPNLGYRRLVKILRERYKLPVSRPAVQSVLKRLRSSDQASVGNIEHCSEKLVHETRSDTIEMRDIDDIPSEVTMATDSVFTIARGESTSSTNLTGEMKRFIDNIYSKRVILRKTQKRVADEVSQLSGQKFTQSLISNVELKAISVYQFLKFKPFFQKWLRQQEMPPTNHVEVLGESCTHDHVQKCECVLHCGQCAVTDAS